MKRPWLLLCVFLAPLAVCTAAVRADDLDEQFRKKLEAEKVARIEAAERLRKDNEARMAKLEASLAELRQWTQVQFQVAERDEINKPQAVRKIVEQWQRNRENEVFELLQFPERSLGAIESGRALNALLRELGPAAYQYQLNRKSNPDYALPLRTHTETLLGEDVTGKLSYQTKTLGPKAVGRFNEPPLDVDWPVALREDRWSERRAAIETARQKLLEQLVDGHGVSPELSAELRTAVAELNQDFSEYRRSWVKEGPSTSASRSFEYRQLCIAKRHIEKLICTVYQVVEATSLGDVMPAESFRSGNIEELLAYMQRNNLQFAAATKTTDRDAYQTVFNQMVWYYLDLAAITKAEAALEQQLAAAEQTNQEATDLILGKTLTAGEQAALMIEAMKFVRALVGEE